MAAEESKEDDYEYEYYDEEDPEASPTNLRMKKTDPVVERKDMPKKPDPVAEKKESPRKPLIKESPKK